MKNQTITTQYTLLIHTDTYAGNIDCQIAGLLFGFTDDRYGAAEAVRQHLEVFTEQEHEELFGGLFELRPHEDYGDVPYTISKELDTKGQNHNSTAMFIDADNIDRLPAALAAVATRFGPNIQLKSCWEPALKVQILGYHIKVDTTLTTVTKLGTFQKVL